MKKIIITIIGFLAIMAFTGSAYAGTWAQTAAGSAVTVTASGTYPTLSFTPSPGTVFEGANTATVYCLLSANTKAVGDAIAYSLVSTTNAVYQATVTMTGADTAIPTYAPTTDGTAISGFTSK